MADKQVFDHALWLHEHQTAQDEPDDLGPIPSESEKPATGRNLIGTAELSRLGGKARQKQLRAEKREERRQERMRRTGVTIHYDHRAWSKLGKAAQEAFSARKQSLGLTTVPETGLTWDFERDFWDYTSTNGAEHLDILFRSGRAIPQKQRSPYSPGVGRAGFRPDGHGPRQSYRGRIIERRVWC